MKTVADDYDFIESVGNVWSVGGHSEEFLRETFTNGPQERVKETAYVSANPFAGNVADLPFAIFEDLNELNYGVDSPVAPAHVVTDRAIDIGRSESTDQQIVHYMQPHKPFLESGDSRTEVSVANWSKGTDLYHAYFTGDQSKEDLHNGYVNNLRHVLDEVGRLLENVDAEKVVITADHGHALGERFLWDHRQGVHHPVIRRVPWIETSAENFATLEPSTYESINQSDEEIEEQLEALGYR
jgi:hypothetical protein